MGPPFSFPSHKPIRKPLIEKPKDGAFEIEESLSESRISWATQILQSCNPYYAKKNPYFNFLPVVY